LSEMRSLSLLLAPLLAADAYVLTGGCHRATVPAAAAARSDAPVMDETVIQKALSGELEQEGAENPFMSEAGWATYLDKECGSSYNMNMRVSKADDGYFTPTIFSNPLDVITEWAESMKGVVSDPLSVSFPTITNDVSGARSYPKGSSEVNARTIKPKVKDFDPAMRTAGIPGYNLFGAPGSKLEEDKTGKVGGSGGIWGWFKE